jgi:hypothetical protein
MGEKVDEKRQKEQLGGRTMDCSTEGRQNEGGKNNDKKIVIVKLIIQEEKNLPGSGTTQSSVFQYSYGVIS